MTYFPLKDSDNQHQILVLLFRNSNRYPAPGSIIASYASIDEAVEVGIDGQQIRTMHLDNSVIAVEQLEKSVRFPVLVQSIEFEPGVKLICSDFDGARIEFSDASQVIDCRMIWNQRFLELTEQGLSPFDDDYAIDLRSLSKSFSFVTKNMPYENCRILTRDSGLLEEYFLELSKKPGFESIYDNVIDTVRDNPIYKTWAGPKWTIDNPVIVIDHDCLFDVFEGSVRVLPYAQAALSIMFSMGIEITIATEYTGPNFTKFVDWMQSSNMPFETINLNSKNRIKVLHGDPRHLSGDVYVSKKNLGGFPGWPTTMNLLFGYTIEHLDTYSVIEQNEQ